MPPVLPNASLPVTMPSGNPGLMAEGMASVRQAVKMLEAALPKLGAESEPGKAVLESIKKLASIAPQSDGNAGIDAAALRNIVAQASRAAPMQALMRSSGGPGAPPPQNAGY